MSYEQPALDRTTAWVVSCLCAVGLVIVLAFAMNYWHNAEIERDFIKAGYCQVWNPTNTSVHWEKCPPAK